MLLWKYKNECRTLETKPSIKLKHVHLRLSFNNLLCPIRKTSRDYASLQLLTI